MGISDTLKRAQEEIKSITIASIKEILPLQNEKFISKESNVLLVKIRNRLASYVRECDYETYNAVLSELNNKIRELIQTGNDRRLTGEVFQALKFILDPSTFEALRVNNYQFYESVWECIDALYEYAYKNKIQLLHYEELDSFIRSYTLFLSTNKLSDALKKGAKVLTNAFILNLNYNCPPQNKTINLYWVYEPDDVTFENDSKAGMQWMKIEELFSSIGEIYFKSVEILDKELYQECNFSTGQIIFDIKYGDLRKLEKYQERRIVDNIFQLRTEAADLANKKNMYDYFSWTFNLDEFSISEFIEQKKSYVKDVLERTSDCLIKSQRLKKINDDSLNNFGGIGRVVCKEYCKNEIARKAIEYILKSFVYLKEYIEENQLPDEAKNYNQIKSEVDSFRRVLNQYYPNQKFDIIDQIDKIVSSFKPIISSSDFRIIKWD